MATFNNIISFEPNRLFDSKLLTLLVECINDTAQLTFMFIVIDIILSMFNINSEIFTIPDLLDIMSTFIVMLVIRLCWGWAINTKIDVNRKVLQVQVLFPKRINIMEIEKVIIRTSKSIVIVKNPQGNMQTSIRDYTKFIALLQELNPNIEVEYKE
jgi:hypothetical protein